ncbi:Exostosin-like [Thalictrum thalictroides]|uniref:Exostosin-like n=1 Tax=Thalictrum thalictroides TaxID=46969 RepID=A0A7J6X066_THATH|nr:Exostosin-like [Thalictrum thalictroides]
MSGKTLLSIFSVFFILIPLYLFIGTADLKSHFFPLSQPSTTSFLCPTATQHQPLRVFMYDLPTRFNLAMISREFSSDETPVNTRNFPPWPSNSGLRHQHSVEYWMMASLMYEEGSEKVEEGREAVRVSDPDMADVFFVPFFSSTSFNTHGHNMTDPETEIDRQLQVFLFISLNF